MSSALGSVPRRRKKVFPFHYSAEKKLVHIVVTMKDKPGALAELLNLLAKDVNLIGSNSYDTERGEALFSGFGEVLSPSATPDSIKKLVRGSGEALGCSVWMSNQGFLVDKFHTGVETAMGDPYIMLPVSGLAKTFDSIGKSLGSGGDLVLYLEGQAMANARFGAFRKILGPHPERRMQEVTHVFEALGYGSSTISGPDEDGALKLVVTDCFECSGRGKSSAHSCAFMRGLARGSIGAAVGKELECTETRCRMRGDTECEFLLAPQLP